MNDTEQVAKSFQEAVDNYRKAVEDFIRDSSAVVLEMTLTMAMLQIEILEFEKERLAKEIEAAKSNSVVVIHKAIRDSAERLISSGQLDVVLNRSFGVRRRGHGDDGH